MMGNKRKLKTLLPWLLVIIWMLLIFSLSGQTADQSNKLSTGVTEKVIETVKKVTHLSDSSLDNVNHIVRKSAHFFAYLLLAILVLNALRTSRQPGLKKVGITIIICVLYACSDEFHQLFVPGRGAQVRDVFIDSAGSITGIGFYMGMRKIVRRKLDKKAMI